MPVSARLPLLLTLFALTPVSHGQEAHTPLTFSFCQLWDGGYSRDARCTSMQRPRDPQRPEGDQVELFVARIPSRASEPQPDPLVLISGGPGGSSVDLYLQLRGVFNAVRNHRDILLVDQRGTGRSEALRCPDLEELESARPQQARQAARRCLAELDADPRYYTTSIAVEDLEAVREAAGYTHLNFYGSSYGSRVALHYLRRYPQHSRVLILDGVVPPGWVLGDDVARAAQHAFDRLVERCEASPLCVERFGDLHRTLARLQSALSEPVSVSLPDPRHGGLVTHLLSQDDLLGVVRFSGYSAEQSALLPLVLQRALQGDYAPLTAQALLLRRELGRNIASAMHYSVVCAEDMPHITTEPETLADTYLGGRALAVMQAVCEVWPRGPVDADFHEPLRADHPVLILSGQYDPVTPPENGARLAATLNNSLHLEVAGQGHGVAMRGCLPQLMARFIESGSLQELPTGCVEREAAATLPLFLDSAGPGP